MEQKINSYLGELRLLNETVGLKQKVEIWLLNDKTNRNNWRYENLEEHKKLFAETPILIAYVGNKIGDGHNFEQVRDENGNVVASFMDATAERIVGYFKEEDDIRIEEINGNKWVVGTGYIWKWYAVELVQKLKEQGREGMSISIETLVDEWHMDGSTEVFTKYKILGTTILGDDVEPAVKDASIKVLSKLNENEVRELTLRVASKIEKEETEIENKKAGNNSNTRSKIQMKKVTKEIREKFADYKVLAMTENQVALLTKDGELCVGDIETLEVNSAEYVINVGENLDVKLNELVAEYKTSINSLNTEVETLKVSEAKAKEDLVKMQNAEHARRIDAIKETVLARICELRDNNIAEICEKDCEDILSEDSLNGYAKLEDADGKFIGCEAAKTAVDGIGMNFAIKANKQKLKANSNVKYAWEGENASKNNDGIGDVLNKAKEQSKNN